MKNMSNPTINDVIIIFLKDDLKEKPIAIGLLVNIKCSTEGAYKILCYCFNSNPNPSPKLTWLKVREI